jgi:phosphatidylinositol alpha 1,6-mannosyltransferase
MRRLTRSVHGSVERTLVPSSASHQQLDELGIGRLHRWGRGVDTELFSPGRRTHEVRESLRRELGGERLVGYVGRLAPEKELELLQHVQDLPGTRLVVVGGGPERQRLERLLAGTAFLGVRSGEELAGIVASLDVFVHTGRTETFCQSAQEALASGVPVVAPRAGGPVDLVTDDVNGFLYAPGDGKQLRAHVTRLLGDAALRERLGRAARDGVATRSWTSVNEQLVDHYRDVVHAVPLPQSA